MVTDIVIQLTRGGIEVPDLALTEEASKEQMRKVRSKRPQDR